MDVAVILTYRCNSKCSMCNIWKYPTHPKEEVTLETMDKIPYGVDYLNLTGGEPTLRSDLPDIVDLLYPRAMQLEISSNGLHAERLEPIIKKYPDMKVRFSLEGFELTNNAIRGEVDGFNKKVNGLLRLQELGVRILGLRLRSRMIMLKRSLSSFCLQRSTGWSWPPQHSTTVFNSIKVTMCPTTASGWQIILKD